MAINDILGRVLRPLGLAAAVSGCGGEEKANLYGPCSESEDRCSSIESYNSDRGICLISPYGSGQPSFCSFPCYVSVRPSELSESIEKLRGTCTTDAHGCDYSGMDERETPPGCCYMANPSALPKSFGGGWIGGGYCLPYPPKNGGDPEGNGGGNRSDVCERICSNVACTEDFKLDAYSDRCVSECLNDIFEECSDDVLREVGGCLDVQDEKGRRCNDPWIKCLDAIPGIYDCARP